MDVSHLLAHVGDVLNGESGIWCNAVSLKIDLGKIGFDAVLKPYQIEVMKYLWAHPDEGKSSKGVYDAVIEALPDGKNISRPSIINTLNTLADERVLGFHTITVRGGSCRIYWPRYDESEYKQYIVETVLKKLLHDSPEETKKVIQEKI